MDARFMAAFASAAVLVAGAGAAAQTTAEPSATPTYAPVVQPAGPAGTRTMPVPPGRALALDARSLRGIRTAAGYRLKGQALVQDACTAARFEQFLGTIFPPQFNLVQYRRPGTLGLLCIQRLTWVLAQARDVTSAAPPRYVTVRTQKAVTRVPVLPGPH